LFFIFDYSAVQLTKALAFCYNDNGFIGEGLPDDRDWFRKGLAEKSIPL